MTVVGTALSCGMEIAQFHDVGRVTSMGDVYANLIGSGVGGLAAVSIGASMRWPFVRELVAHPAASLLLIMFFGYRLYPLRADDRYAQILACRAADAGSAEPATGRTVRVSRSPGC